MVSKRKRQLRDLLICCNIVQLFLICIFTLYIFLSTQNMSNFFGFNILPLTQAATALLFLSLSLAILNGYLVLELNKINKLQVELAETKVAQEMSEKNLRLLRCQRHDFLNHLQVILGYLQMGKIPQAIKYIKGINEELKGIRVISGLSMPEISVLLLVKKQEAEKHSIKFDYNLKTDLSDVHIQEHDLVRILANLIDNAIYELKNVNVENKTINITMETVGEALFLEVFNTGSYITNTAKIFNFGYTTRGPEGSGYGLYTVKELVEKKYKGKVNVTSDKELGTRFKIVV